MNSELSRVFYWLKTLALETLMLLYVRSTREGNFQLYLESQTKIMPWMFALDHTHYSRWLPVHIRDMTLLSENHPRIYVEFCAGKFVVHKTCNKFSAMSTNQCHEQNNAVIKELLVEWTPGIVLSYRFTRCDTVSSFGGRGEKSA